MSLNDWRIFFFSTGFIVILIIMLTSVGEFTHKNEEQFTAMAILSEGKTESKYFLDGNANVTKGEVMNWNIYLYNHMNSTQYVSVKVKILDSHMISPNNVLGTPSIAPSLYENGCILAKNETAIIPFQWVIMNATESDDSLIIKKMGFNNNTLDMNLNLVKGDKLRIVLELWVYDTQSQTFKFNMGLGEKPKIVWNQIWFDFKR
jgi:hypothetical protein